MFISERLPALLERRRQILAIAQENAADREADEFGSATSLLMGCLRFIGVAEFVVNANVALFRKYVSDSAKLRLQLLVRHSRGEPISDSYVAMISYQEHFDALAAGDFATADELAEAMGGRTKIEAKHDHPFDYSLGYALKAAVLGPAAEFTERVARFFEICGKPGNKDFAGYAEVFGGLLAHDSQVVRDGLCSIVKGHKRLCAPRRMFNGDVDETLCVWGVGIANLARRQGIAAEGIAPFIHPDVLI